VAYRSIKKHFEEVLININFNKLYILDSINIGYEIGGGFNTSNGNIYIVNKGEKWGYTDTWLEQIIHSELSTHILEAYLNVFDLPSFEDLNREGFEYLKMEEFEKLLNEEKISTRIDTTLFKQGVWDSYSFRDSVQDYNAHVKQLFKNDGLCWEITDLGEFPILSAKRDYIVDWLREEVHPGCTMDYFREVSQQ